MAAKDISEERQYTVDDMDISGIGFFNDLKLVKDSWEPWEWEDIDFLKFLTRGLMAVDGDTGGGKSQFGTLLSWKIRKYWGQQVVVDSSNLFLPPFGKHQVLDWDKVLYELNAMAKEKKLPKQQIIAEHLDPLFKKAGIDLYHKTVFLEEAGKRINKRRLMGDVAQIVGRIVQQWRHYGSLFMFASPSIKKTLDEQQVVDFCMTYVNCAYEAADHCSYYVIKSKFFPGTKLMTIDDETYWPLFNSFSRVSASKKKSNIEEDSDGL